MCVCVFTSLTHSVELIRVVVVLMSAVVGSYRVTPAIYDACNRRLSGSKNKNMESKIKLAGLYPYLLSMFHCRIVAGSLC